MSDTRRRLMILAKGATKGAGIKRATSEPGWEVWTLNDMYFPEVNPTHFELHQWNARYAEWMMSKNDIRRFKKVYMLQHEPTIPNSVAFPIQEVIATHDCNYLCNTIALMLALALHQHKTGDKIHTLACYGVDYLTNETLKILCAKDAAFKGAVDAWTTSEAETFAMGTVESNYGRACTEYWLGRMAECGIKFLVHAQSELFTTSPGWGRHIYGYEGSIVGGKGDV